MSSQRRHPARILFALVLLSFLTTACAVREKRLYQGVQLPSSQVAVVKALDPSQASGGSVRFFLGFESFMKDGDPQRTPVNDMWNGYPTSVESLPGDYTIIAYCASGGFFAHPSIKLRLEAGKTYTLRCGFTPNDVNRFLVSVDSVR
jgi:hypothetical protein